MKRFVYFALGLMALASLATSLAACQEASGDYYDNNIHNGYPGPGTHVEDRDG